jgi:hypothetical protein
VPGQYHVEIEQDHQAEHRPDGVQRGTGQARGGPRGARVPADRPGDQGHGGTTGRRPRERPRRRTGDQQPGQRATHPRQRLQRDQNRERDEPVPALQGTAQRGEHGQRGERDREQQRGQRIAHVQQAHEGRARHQRAGRDQRAERQAEPERRAVPAPRRARLRHPQGHPGLRGDRRYRADQQHREQRAQFAERGRGQGPGGEHREDVAGRVGAEQGHRDEERGEPDGPGPVGTGGAVGRSRERIDCDHGTPPPATGR